MSGEFIPPGDDTSKQIVGYKSDGSPIYSDGSTGSSVDQKENDALANLASIANYNANALQGKYSHGIDMYNIADDQARRLANAQTEQNKRNMGDDWFEQMKKFQSSADKIKNTAGDSFTGSNLYNFMDLLERENDSIRNETLSTQRKNQDEINNDLYETLSQNVNARNELANDVDYGLHNIISDWAAQATSVAPDKARGQGIFAEDQGAGAGTINTPGWLNPEGWYDQHKVGPADITKQGWYLEDNAQQNANQKQQQTTPSSSNANSDYWDNLFGKYNKRY